MNKQYIIDTLNVLKKELLELRARLSKLESENVYKKELKDSAQALARKWFEEIEHAIQHYSVSEELRTKYHRLFTTLLKLSFKVSRKKTYLKTINEILSNFETDLLMSILKSAGQVVRIDHLAKILENVTEEEKEYLKEALGCASRGFFEHL
jgi:iron-sulfur cluster repair protein YtfE (RIC family)